MRLTALFLLFFALQATGAENLFDKPVLHPAIPLLDENNQHVLQSGKPYSTKMSCGSEFGGCHDINKISKAYHFDMGRDESDDHFGSKRQVVPLVSPGYFGGYNCMLGNNPLWLSKKDNQSENEFLDYGTPGLIRICGSCHNGGGFGELDRQGIPYASADSASVKKWDGDYYDIGATNPTPAVWDWKKSGPSEPDCLLCHADFSQLRNNPDIPNDGLLKCQGMECAVNATSEWNNIRSNQILKFGHFRYSNSIIFKYLNVGHTSNDPQFLLKNVSNLSSTTPPKLEWNPQAFDANGKMQMPMLRFPDNKNCMFCHITSNQRRGFYGLGDSSRMEQDANGNFINDYHDDVHKTKPWTEKNEKRDIENCNACHSKQYYKATYLNIDIDADHNFLVGNSDQDVRRDLNFQPGPLSCEYCHSGKSYGGADKPALPATGYDNILDAHRDLWTKNGDMVGYAANTLNKVTQVHIDSVACQTCHTRNLQYDNKVLNVLYRYRESENGRLKITPYQTTARYYWWDKNNQRILSRRERLSVTGADKDPSSYDEIKKLKADFDALLSSKGYNKPDTQMVWTESNDYLISHNAKPAKQAMPCDDCHDRKSNNSVSSLVKSNGVLGSKNIQRVASLSDKSAYRKLVDEGIVKLDMPYYQIANDGSIIANVEEILYETKINPFNSALKATDQSISSGAFRLVSTDEALSTLGITNDSLVRDQINSLSKTNQFIFSNRMTGDEIKQFNLVLGLNNSTKTSVPDLRFEVSSALWTSFKTQTSNSKTQTIKSFSVAQGNIKGTVSSSVLSFAFLDQQRQKTLSLAQNKMLVKIPYAGKSSIPANVGLFALKADANGVLAKTPFSNTNAQIISVMPGNTTNFGYVLAVLSELPERAVILDIKTIKK
jgi:hypothetical protein